MLRREARPPQWQPDGPDRIVVVLTIVAIVLAAVAILMVASVSP